MQVINCNNSEELRELYQCTKDGYSHSLLAVQREYLEAIYAKYGSADTLQKLTGINRSNFHRWERSMEMRISSALALERLLGEKKIKFLNYLKKRAVD